MSFQCDSASLSEHRPLSKWFVPLIHPLLHLSLQHTVPSRGHPVKRGKGAILDPKVTLDQWAHQDARGTGDQKERKERKVNKCMLAEEKEEVLGFKERGSSVLHWAAFPAACKELA